MKKIIIITAVFCLLLPFSTVKAATMYLKPDQGEFHIGDVFTVDIKVDLDSPEECINTIEGVIGFDRDYIEAVDFSTGDSIISLWINLPKTGDIQSVNHEKRLKFTGGIPGGYCGKIPGDSGDSNILGKLVFKVQPTAPLNEAMKSAKVFFYNDTLALLNDGMGTQTKLVFKDANFNIVSTGNGSTEQWDILKQQDRVEPEPFIIEVLQNAEIYEGKYYLVWSTTDKQTGVDHYEVSEGRDTSDDGQRPWWQSLAALFERKQEEQWQVAKPPYVLQDQSLKSLIRVKAVDKAGNERLSEYYPPEEARQTSAWSRYFPLIVVLLVIIAVIMPAIYGLRKRRKTRVN